MTATDACPRLQGSLRNLTSGLYLEDVTPAKGRVEKVTTWHKGARTGVSAPLMHNDFSHCRWHGHSCLGTFSTLPKAGVHSEGKTRTRKTKPKSCLVFLVRGTPEIACSLQFEAFFFNALPGLPIPVAVRESRLALTSSPRRVIFSVRSESGSHAKDTS